MTEDSRSRVRDFFEAVPEGAGAYVLKYIIHDWNDENAARILTNCAKAAAPGAKVLLIEQIVPETVRASVADQTIIRGDLVMMTVGGKERTEKEYRDLCGSAGLSIESIVTTPSGFSVIETGHQM